MREMGGGERDGGRDGRREGCTCDKVDEDSD